MLASPHSAGFEAKLTGRGIVVTYKGKWYWKDPAHYRMELTRDYRREMGARVLQRTVRRLLVRNEAERYNASEPLSGMPSGWVCRDRKMIPMLERIEPCASDRRPPLLWLRDNRELYDFSPVSPSDKASRLTGIRGALSLERFMATSDERHQTIQRFFPKLAQMLPQVAKVYNCSLPEAMAVSYPYSVTLGIDPETKFVTTFSFQAGPEPRGLHGCVFRKIVWRQDGITLDRDLPAELFTYKPPKNAIITTITLPPSAKEPPPEE